MPNGVSDSSDRVLKRPQSCQSQKYHYKANSGRSQADDPKKTPVLATQVLGQTPDVSAGVQAACTDQSPMNPICESAEQSTLLT